MSIKTWPLFSVILPYSIITIFDKIYQDIEPFADDIRIKE